MACFKVTSVRHLMVLSFYMLRLSFRFSIFSKDKESFTESQLTASQITGHRFTKNITMYYVLRANIYMYKSYKYVDLVLRANIYKLPCYTISL